MSTASCGTGCCGTRTPPRRSGCSASPLSQTPEGVRRLASAGVGAVVLPSLFEEQIRHEQARDLQVTEPYDDSFGEALSYFPSRAESPGGAAHYLHLVERAVAVAEV